MPFYIPFAMAAVDRSLDIGTQILTVVIGAAAKCCSSLLEGHCMCQSKGSVCEPAVLSSWPMTVCTLTQCTQSHSSF